MNGLGPARSVDEVLARLDAVVEASRRANSRAGYFAALYRKVTAAVKRGIARGDFDDGPRMERLDVTFANRYLEAYDRHGNGQSTTHAWRVAFEACGAWWPIVLQHLLMGMNAHINLDLGIAAAQTSPGSELASLKGDFMRINEILASLVDEVQEELADVWPLLRILDWVGGRTDEAVVHFSMERARDAAWAVAQDLARREATEWSGAIAALDNRVAELGRLVRHPGPILGAATRLIRLGELRSVRRIINVLR